MSDSIEPIRQFVEYSNGLKGDEKGEAQVFCDRLFQAFGHGGYKEAGATLEFRVKGPGKGTKFADLLWRPRLLIEMKTKGEKLQRQYSQAFEYWLQLVPQRPKYVVLCNFDEFWIYDFDTQLNDLVDVVPLADLRSRPAAPRSKAISVTPPTPFSTPSPGRNPRRWLRQKSGRCRRGAAAVAATDHGGSR